VLEPVRANSSIRSFPLAPGRYLIGSADDCDLIIPVGGVAPQHCLIVVGTNRTIVKALSPLTWVDDGPLSESVLQLGQKLIIGPVELRTRRPDVSEWLEDSEPAARAIPEPVTYAPPQIEVLLDQARQQLDTALADELPADDSWSEDLPLSEAVDRHANAAQTESAEHLRSAELERQELELNERARSLEYLASELTAQEHALLTRESAISQRQTGLEQLSEELRSREQAILEREQSLASEDAATVEARQHLELQQQELIARAQKLEDSLTAIEQQNQQLVDHQTHIAELQGELDRYRAELQLREEQIESQLAELHQQRDELAVRESHLTVREQTWTARESELVAQVQQLQEELRDQQAASPTNAMGLLSAEALTGREDDLRYREESVTRREAVLAQSQASLKASQEQLREEAELIESRFADLMQREQALPARLVALHEEVRQVECHLAEMRQQQSLLLEREQQIEARLAAVSEREAVILQSQKTQETRERELRNLRSELDIREEALSQQYAQLQLDRSTLRAAQTRLQLAEQSLQQREVPQADPTLVDREQALAERTQALEEQSTELHRREHELSQLAESLRLRETELAEEQSRLSACRSELEGLRQEHETQLGLLDAAPVMSIDAQATQDELALQLQSLVEERDALTRLKEETLEEQRGLKAERDELRKVRLQFDQEREQFQELKQQAQTERDTFLLERQEIVTERQALRDRERQIRVKETDAARLEEEVHRSREELTISLSRLEEERVHLNEEWDVLRQERAELANTQASLDAQRDELSAVALEMAQLQNGSIDDVAEPFTAEHEASEFVEPPVTDMSEEAHVDSAEQIHDVSEALVDEAESEWSEAVEEQDEEEVEPELAGLSNFSSIGEFSEEGIPPEVAEILRKTAGQHVAPPPPAPASVPSSITSRLDALLGRKPASAESENDEQRRVKELLASPTSDFVDEASQSMLDEAELESADAYEKEEELPAQEESDSEPMMEANGPTSEPAAPVRPNDDIRSRLSEMFGITLGASKSAPAPVTHHESVEEAAEEAYEEEAAYDENEQYEEDEPSQQDESEAVAEEEPSSANLDPVAAYMEQLLARTRKGKSAVPPAPALKKVVEPPPAEVAAVAPVKAEPDLKAPEPMPEPDEVQRAPRKLDRAEKEALRANLDSFRTIANSQARSDVARSELRRLKVTVKVKRVFVGVSAVIGLVLISTLIWSEKAYYLEILAAIIATAFLSIDFVRTEKRLRELASSMPEDDEPAVF
jgi:hypothetical protein